MDITTTDGTTETSASEAVSDTNVSGIHNVLRKIPWKVVLPLLMAAATTRLYYLDRAWLRASDGWDDLPVSTARGLAALINGPGAPLSGMNLLGQLLGVAIFWAWSGFLLDRRLRGVRTPVVRRVWVRVAIYLIGLIVACWSAWSVARFFGPETLKYLSRLPSILLSNSPRRMLLGRDFIEIAELVWGSGYAVYFTHKLWRLAADRRKEATA